MADVSVLDRASQLISQIRGRALADQQREKPALWERAQEIFQGAQSEGRAMTPDESARYDELTGLIAEINQREQQERQHLELERTLREPQRDGRVLPGAGPSAAAGEAEGYREAFRSFVRGGFDELDPDQRRLVRAGFRRADPEETRALGTISGPAGGYLVPSSFQAQLIETLKAYSPVESIVTPLVTDTGADIDWPTNDDTANVGATVAESADVSNATDPEFGIKTVRAYLYTSRIFRVPFTLLQDSAIDIEAYIGRIAGQRLGRILAQHFATGNGVNKLEGITVGGSVGKAFASATAVTYPELIDLEHSVDPAYRSPDRCRYLFRDATFAALRKLVDSQNRPLWVPWLGSGVAGAPPATFNGWRYQIVQDMPAMAAGQNSIAFGDFDAGYKYRRVSGMSLIRIEERFVEHGQVGFLMFARADGRVIDQAAFKLGQQA